MSNFDPLRYWERRLGEFDLSVVGYAGLGLGFNRWLYRLRRALFRRAVRCVRRDWQGLSVLDVGSGTGFYVSEWLRTGASVTGSDLTRASVERLSIYFPEQDFVQLDIADPPPFGPGSFDAVSAFDVLFHIVDDDRYRAALRNVSLILKDGGYVIFSENFVHGKTVRGGHVASRSLGEICGLLDDAGLEVVLRRPMFVLMNVPIDSRSRFLRMYWSVLERGVSRFPFLGGVAGAALYPLEFLLVSVRKEGPSTELMICRKRAAQ